MGSDDKREDGDLSLRADTARRPYFGRRLRELRSTYLSRIMGSGTQGPPLRTTPSASTLVHCLAGQGVKISTAAYNEIETGLNVPRNAIGFLDAVARCLNLTPEEKRDLERRLAYDLLWARLRERTDDVFPPSEGWPAPDW